MTRITDKIDQIETALDKGNLVNTRLQVVKKHGFKWAWLRFTQWLVKIFSCCTGQKPWQDYKADAVMKALKVYVQNEMSPEMQDRLTRIESLLKKNKIIPTKVEKSLAPTVEMQKALAGIAHDLCNTIVSNSPEKSMALSPVSIIAALGMFLHGIQEDKKALFLEKIGLKGMLEADAHQLIANTLKSMAFPADFKEGTFEIAQGIALKNDIIPSNSLMQLVSKTYGAEFIQSDNLQEEVNKWVAQKTHDKIPTILDDNDSSFALLNALYLAFQWKDKFKPLCKDGWDVKDFTCFDGTTAPVSMMTQTAECGLYKGEYFKMLEKPYISPEGRKLSQLIFMADKVALDIMEKDLTFDKILDCRKNASIKEVELSMPKIKAETQLELTDILMALGLPIDSVDSSIMPSNDVKVIHKTFVLNDEKGSEAAAVTGVFTKECARVLPHFNINQAYAYFIMDGDTVLFRGRVADKDPLVVDQK